MSFLEKEESKQSSVWDWVVGIGIILLIAGFTVYYQYQKKSSLSRFEQADILFKAHNLKDAGKMYEELKSAQYLTTTDDSIINVRLDTVETAREQQAAVIVMAKAKAIKGDSLGVPATLKEITYPELLSEEDKAWLDSVKSSTQMAAKP